jgi:hypothetical protein
LLTDGAECGDAGQGHVRLNFATPRPVLTEIVRRLADAVSDEPVPPSLRPFVIFGVYVSYCVDEWLNAQRI